MSSGIGCCITRSIARMDSGIGWNMKRRGSGTGEGQGQGQRQMRIASDLRLLSRTFVCQLAHDSSPTAAGRGISRRETGEAWTKESDLRGRHHCPDPFDLINKTLNFFFNCFVTYLSVLCSVRSQCKRKDLRTSPFCFNLYISLIKTFATITQVRGAKASTAWIG